MERKKQVLARSQAAAEALAAEKAALAAEAAEAKLALEAGAPLLCGLFSSLDPRPPRGFFVPDEWQEVCKYFGY